MKTSCQTFLSALTNTDRQWLADQLLCAEHVPPPDWRRWFISRGDQIFRAGLVQRDRLDSLVESVPGFQRKDTGAVWVLDVAAGAETSHRLNAWLRGQHHAGLMSDWRNELQDWRAIESDEAAERVLPHHDEPLGEETATLRLERAGLRHLGLRSRAVHVNGFLADGRIWVGKRSMTKRFDPGLFDNLMAGGVGAGETDQQTFERELWEEAGILASSLSAPDWRGCILVGRAEGPDWHSETLSVCNVDLPEGIAPHNRDGEVSGFELMRAGEVVHRMRAGEFTHDGVMSLAHGLGLAGCCS